jgi:hypothetical protein
MFQLKVNTIHTKLNCGQGDAVTVPVKPEQFLKNQVPVGKLIQHQYIMVSDLIGGAIEESASNQSDSQKHIAKSCL